MAKMNINYSVKLYDAWSSFENGKWIDYVSVRPYRNIDPACREAYRLRNKGIKTNKGYSDKWLIEVTEHNHTLNTKTIVLSIQF